MGQCCSNLSLDGLSEKTDLQKVQIYGPLNCEILQEQDAQQLFQNEVRTQVDLKDLRQQYLIEENDNIEEQRVALPYIKLLTKDVIYKGQWKNKQMDGYGQMLHIPSKTYYCGKFQQGELQGRGFMIYSNGDIYEGSFKNNTAHEYGVFKTIDGQTYKGQWQNGEKHGKGDYQDKYYQYIGNFCRGCKQGEGVLEFYDTFRYKGQFQNNKFQGQGELEYLDGSRRKYIGEYQDNKKSGQGHFIWPLYEYKGQYQDDLRNGQGDIIFNEGIKVSGIFVNGKLHDSQAKIIIGDREIQAQFIDGNIVSQNDELPDQIKTLFSLHDFDEDIN
ncbi:MORN motif protein (macronuclear) [Tetrahymena thermophila SB210]|uniref:MORN motif protein n=1 Tax=Tetrahymena thermophila (strain SB210) TaxID=312017 RepID=I7LZG3_TETTS|nr:MORN motif protein [Tetrahymena thermophila SB210]EAR83829.1 MORN motif protein [Tetrahymena thermophila SB210]|eukprot:XP_001031492.1 MORN motif protein [Tetrahymena thermophila SB210]